MTQRIYTPPQSDSLSADALSIPVYTWGASDKGQQRESNEDSIYPEVKDNFFTPSPETLKAKGRMFIVADGMGGVRAGAEASRWAIRVAVERYYDSQSDDIRANLDIAVQAANTSLYKYLLDTNADGAGCTMTVAVIHRNFLHVVNVGDSRVYLIRGNDIGQITRDHTVTQQKVDQGLIMPEEVENDPDRNVLYRSLGTKTEVIVDTFPPIQLFRGDTVLLCSDGLTDMLSNEELLVIIKGQANRAVKRLISSANKLGGPDNISALLAYVGNPTVRLTNNSVSAQHSTNPLSHESINVAGTKFRVSRIIKLIGLFFALVIITMLIYWLFFTKGFIEVN